MCLACHIDKQPLRCDVTERGFSVRISLVEAYRSLRQARDQVADAKMKSTTVLFLTLLFIIAAVFRW